jgi:hypothetical protein
VDTVSVEHVLVGDILIVKEGDVPARRWDRELGAGPLDEAALTGSR